ncbi:MAG: carboxypeptidase-like regulatory domain-containing protein [Candidatus Korobacteraceae bacterium]
MLRSAGSTLAILCFTLLFSTPLLWAQAAEQGTITGVVTDDMRRTALRGAQVTVENTFQSAISDASGRFRLTNVPAGEVRLTVTYLGFDDATHVVTVRAGQSANVESAMSISARTTVTGVGEPLFEGQAKALN